MIRWVKVDGTLYKKPCALLLGTDNDLPLFSNLQEILIAREEVYFNVKLFETICYNPHYHAYVVFPTEQYQTIHRSELYSHLPLHTRNVQGLTSCLKHHVSTL